MADTYERKLLIHLCRENAPAIYVETVLPKIQRFEIELAELRKKWFNEKDEVMKKTLKKRADFIKSELDIYKS